MGRRAYPRGFLLVPMRAWTRVSNMRWRSVLLKHLRGFVSHRGDATSGPSGDACDRPEADGRYGSPVTAGFRGASAVGLWFPTKASRSERWPDAMYWRRPRLSRPTIAIMHAFNRDDDIRYRGRA